MKKENTVTYTVVKIEAHPQWGKLYFAAFEDNPAIRRYEKTFMADIFEYINAGKTVIIKQGGK